MMDRLDQMPGLGTTPVIALVALLIGLLMLQKVRRGEALFRGSPQRRVGLGAVDLFVGLILMHAVVAAAFGGAIAVWGQAEGGGMELAGLSEAQNLLVQSGAMVAGLGAVLGYLALRAGGRRGWMWRLGLLMRRPGPEVWLTCKVTLVALPFVLGLGTAVQVISLVLTGEVPQIGHTMLDLLMKTESAATMVVIVLMAVVVAPLGEELVYRGLVQTSLLGFMRRIGRPRRWPVIVGASALFALIHMGAVPWQSLPALMALGVFFGYVYERSGSLWPGVLLHAVFNALNLAMAWLLFGGGAAPG